jgi:alcohol dehydrogenase (cytochrome c)
MLAACVSPRLSGMRASATSRGQQLGQAAYAHSCLRCHGTKLEGGEFGPPLKGAAFGARWHNQPGDALLQYIATKMPPAGPGSLNRQTYAVLETYIRQANAGLSSGAALAAAAAGAGLSDKAAAAQAEEAERNARLFSAAIERDAVYTATVARRTELLGDISTVSEQLLRTPPESDWLHWRRTYDALGYSPLKQINRDNVATLRTRWSWSLPPSVNEITPLVHDGVMFIASGASVEALNAATGERLWQYLRTLPDEADGGRTARAKCLAIFGDRIYAPTADGHVVALESRSGKLVWDHQVVTPEQGPRQGESDGSPFRLDGGPVIAKGKIILGVSLGVTHGKGGAYILALDAQSGQEVWRFDTVARPGQPGGNSWNGHPVDERYGAGVWTPGSYDPELNLVYFGTGNTYATATLLVPEPTERPENLGLYTDSTVALDADSGKLVWYYQHLGRDVWDLDWAFEQSLVTLPFAGRPRKLVVTGGKMALFDAVDRATGEYVFSRDFGLQNVVLDIDPKTGRKIINPEVQPEAGKTKLVCPYGTAGRNWPATSINPETGILFVPLAESCMNHTFTPGSAAETAAGGVDARMEQRVRPDSDGKFGRLQAINLQTGKVLWTQRQRATPSSAMLATGGGLVFSGDHDRQFRAYDEQTGAILWETRLSAAPSSFPITYTVNGEQYLAVVAGGGSALEATRATLTPEIDTSVGNPVLFVFKLPR